MGTCDERREVLIVDDEPAIRFGMRNVLEDHGFRVAEARDCRAARDRLQHRRPDVALVDYRLPDGDALDLLPRLTALRPTVPAIVLTGHGSVDLAVRAMKSGATDFLTKPIEMDSLVRVIEKALPSPWQQDVSDAVGNADTASVANRMVGASGPGPEPDPFVGRSAAIQALAVDAYRIARSEYPVLLLGETGSGKGVLARWIHRQSPRQTESLTELNCAGLSRELLESELFGHGKGAFTGATAVKQGLLEAADGGTLFLDEVGDMDPSVQPKLLKVVEEQSFRRVGELRARQVNLRLIAATHHRLSERVASGEFRSDLYYRLSALTLTLPALRDRPEDLPALCAAILETATRGAGIHVTEGETPTLAPCALDRLTRYEWPGNIRELRNVLQRALLFSEEGVIEERHLRFDPPTTTSQAFPNGFPERSANGYAERFAVPDGGGSLEEAERRLIESALRRHGGNVTASAEQLGVGRSTLYEKIKRYGLRPREA